MKPIRLKFTHDLIAELGLLSHLHVYVFNKLKKKHNILKSFLEALRRIAE